MMMLPQSTRPYLAATALLALAGSLSGCTNGNAQNTDRFAGVEIKTEQLSEGVSVLFGAGGNVGVSHGEDGTILIDDQFAPLTEKIQNAIAAMGADEAGYVINTHWHGDHSGGNENFGNAGATILAHDNVRIRMLGEQTSGRGNSPASPKSALPAVTYADGIKLFMNGDEIHVIHIPTGHTDGDSIVYFKKANVIHMGDTFFNQVTLPFIDLNSGGNATGILASAEKALTLADDNTKIIPGHGPVATRADLVGYRDMMATTIGKVQQAIDAGKTLEETQALDLLKDVNVKKDGFIKPDAFIGFVYSSLKGE